MYKCICRFFSLVAITLLTSCHDSTTESIEIQENPQASDELIEVTQKQFASSGFETATWQEMEFATSIPVAGIIHLPERYKHAITTYMGGVVQDMKLIEGHWVRKGQILFTLTNPDLIDLQQQYLELKSQMEYLSDEVARQQLLSEEQISARKLLVKARAELNQAEARSAGLAKRLELIGIMPEKLTTQDLKATLEVVAPISGYITSLSVNNGSHLNPSEQAMEISSTNGMHLELSVLEKDIAKLARGQKISFTVPSDPARSYTSDIHLIEKVVDEGGMVKVHGDIEPKDMQDLIPGMYVHAQVQVKSERRSALPQEAVVTVDNKSYVLIQSVGDHDKYIKKEIQVAQSSNGFVSFVSEEDIPAGSTFLSKGSYFLIAGE